MKKVASVAGSNIVKVAKSLRRRLTQAEKVLWTHLRNKHCRGLKFRRQQVIGEFIVDFVCFEARLVIELVADNMLLKETRTGRGIPGFVAKGSMS